ncbi:hypothetical protein TNCV_1587691 [Trichonephila clavipes]|uniref:Uncharacterized protein n=1 Tax=Trichonephila clavipes TaxID=2585209 RepID=A0A8X6RJ94_TRICX|nr:hypothetical protein TNCV_1587691 [Trichonephila clavipes]
MPTSSIKDLLKKWADVRAMVLEWHPNQADVSRECGARSVPEGDLKLDLTRFSGMNFNPSMPRGRRSSTRARTARGLLATDLVILNHGQVTWTTPELAPTSPNYHTSPTGGRFSSRQI